MSTYDLVIIGAAQAAGARAPRWVSGGGGRHALIGSKLTSHIRRSVQISAWHRQAPLGKEHQ
jgi:hypothetical protein